MFRAALPVRPRRLRVPDPRAVRALTDRTGKDRRMSAAECHQMLSVPVGSSSTSAFGSHEPTAHLAVETFGITLPSTPRRQATL